MTFDTAMNLLTAMRLITLCLLLYSIRQIYVKYCLPNSGCALNQCGLGSFHCAYWGLQEYGSIKSQENAASSADTKQVQYLQDKGAISSSRAYSSSGIVPAGAQSMLVCKNTAAEYGKDLLLIMLSDRPRAWSRRERAWGCAVSQKLSQTMG